MDGTKTHENLKAAFAGESQANRRYLFLQEQQISRVILKQQEVFKNTADGETGHAFGHLEFMEKNGGGDPATGLSIGETEDNLKAAVAGETYEYTKCILGLLQLQEKKVLMKLLSGLKHGKSRKNLMRKFQETLDEVSKRK